MNSRCIIVVTLICSFLNCFAFNDKTFYHRAVANVSPNGAGKVYVSDVYPCTISESSFASNQIQKDKSTFVVYPANGSVNSANCYFYLFAKPEHGYGLLKWSKGETQVSSSRTYAVSHQSTSINSSSPTTETYVAQFAETALSVSSADNSKCFVNIDKEINQIGDVVTLTAQPTSPTALYEIGWRKAGTTDIISTDNPFVYNVTEKTHLECVVTGQAPAPALADGYYRLRSANPTTSEGYLQLYLNYLNYTDICGSISGAMSNMPNVVSKAQTKLQDILKISLTPNTLPGTVIYLKRHGDSVSEYDLFAQGTSLKEITTGHHNGKARISFNGFYANLAKAGTYSISITLTGSYSSYSISAGTYYFANEANTKFGALPIGDGSKAKWILEPIDESHLESSFFAVQPSNAIFVNGKYYTTTRLSFNCKIPNGSKVVAYAATSLPSDDDILSSNICKKYVEEDIIPAGTPVVIESESLDIEHNKLIPEGDPSGFTSRSNYAVNTAFYNQYGAHVHDVGNDNGGTDQPATQDGVGYFFVKNPGNTPLYKLGVQGGKVGFWTPVGENETIYGNTAYSTTPCALFEDVSTTISLDKTEEFVSGTITATISSVADGAAIEYSLDGGQSWVAYNGPVTLSEALAGEYEIKARATKGYSESLEATATYAFIAPPTITPESATANIGTDITFTVVKGTTSDRVVTQYSLDNGNTWLNVEGNQIVISSDVPTSGTVQVRNYVASSGVASAIATATYTFKSAYEDITLAELIASGDTEGKYNITDVWAKGDEQLADGKLITCKDQKGYTPQDAMPNPIPENETWVDYMQASSATIQSDLDYSVPETYDQSNWIVLRMPEDQKLTGDAMTTMKNCRLTNVKGRLVDAVNPEFQLEMVPTPNQDDMDDSDLNVFVAASFGGTQQSTVNDRYYFFVQPKPMERAYIGWAQWDGTKFVAPVANDYNPGWNQAKLNGEFAYNSLYQTWNAEAPEPGHIYKMEGLVKLAVPATGRAPRRAQGDAKSYEVYPLYLTKTSTVIDGVITGVAGVTGSHEVAGVDYINLAGQRSSRPWQGVNIVVTRYTDGTIQTQKQVH